MLDCRQDTLVFVLLIWFPQTVCGLSCASSLEEASFWDDSHADQFDAVCDVWSEHWQADPPPLQPLQQCWQHSHVYFPNTTSGYDWARALNFFGRPWWGLFWVEPVLLNRCMVLATVLQLSFRVLAIFLKPTPSLCRACEKCEGCTYFCEILYMCIYIYIY